MLDEIKTKKALDLFVKNSINVKNNITQLHPIQLTNSITIEGAEAV